MSVIVMLYEALTAHWFLEEIVHPVFAEIGKKSQVSCKTHGLWNLESWDFGTLGTRLHGLIAVLRVQFNVKYFRPVIYMLKVKPELLKDQVVP